MPLSPSPPLPHPWAHLIVKENAEVFWGSVNILVFPLAAVPYLFIYDYLLSSSHLLLTLMYELASDMKLLVVDHSSDYRNGTLRRFSIFYTRK